MKTLKFIKEIFKKYPLLLTANIILSLLVSALGAVTFFTIGPVVDVYMHPTLEGISPLTIKVINVIKFFNLPINVFVLMSIFLIFVIVTTLILVFAKFVMVKTKDLVLQDTIISTFESFFNAEWNFFSTNNQGVLLNTFEMEARTVGNAFGAMARLFSLALQTTFPLMIPFSISWQVTSISLVIALIFALPFMMLGKYTYKLGRLNTITGNKMISYINQNLVLAKVILGFGNQLKSINALKSIVKERFLVGLKSQVLNSTVITLYMPFVAIMIIIALVVAKTFNVPISDMVVLLVSLRYVALNLGAVINEKNSLENFFPSYEQIKDLKKLSDQMKQHSGAKVFNKFNDCLVIKDLSFAYPNRDLVLSKVNMEIKKGEMIAIVGKSGAGKSTLIDLIMGFYRPNRGDICFDNQSLYDFDIISYRNNIGYVPQESILFDVSIKENLLWAKQDATDEDIYAACRLAHADEFIEGFPEKYNTLVGDRGVRLSGGQLQRIALARAFLRKPELLILDEATSSLDTHSERLIQDAIEKIAKKTTVIVVAHRLSTIKKSDCIYVLDKGQVVEKGTYEELVEGEGKFQSMVKLQELEISC